MRKALRVLGLLILVVVALIVWRALPYRGFQGEIFVEIPRGTSTDQIGNLLVKNGVVRSRWDFLAARIFKPARVLQAGEYKFSHAASPFEVYDRIARGDIFYIELLVPEGKNMFEIGAAAQQAGLFSEGAFVAAAKNPAMIRDIDPRAPSLEGYLFPNTYRVSPKATPERLCQLMTARFREVWRSLDTTKSVHDTVTLASLVEKEGKLADERPRIAAVFENRLRIGMKLDCDPTTIYAAILDDRYRGTIYRSDLDSMSPYNTYRHAGLPPGPIANPGAASIRAVLNPADSDALYFVRLPDNSGAHHFSSTIAEHEAATQQYRRGNHR